MTARVLVVDDDPHLPQLLTRVLAHAGYAADVAASGEQALELFERSPADVALLDVRLPGMSGLETFTKLRQRSPDVIGIFMTAFGSIRSAIDAMRAGGFDYLTKPFDNDQLVLTLDRALELRRLGEEVRVLREELGSRVAFPGIVGRSPRMLEILRLLPRIAASGETALILGESGTGKELVARSLHRASTRASGPFVAVNCSAIPVGLFESEFFGHERGAFTDAHASRIGRIEQAQGGTLFLDEIGDLPLESQAKLLRVLEDRQVVPLGARTSVDVDVRLMAATNKDLQAEVAAGRFRQDLFWRVNVVTIELPPLRDRREDLPLLIRHFIDRLNVEIGRNVTGLTPDASDRLATYGWPGNIRELENMLRRAFVLTESDVITSADLTTAAVECPSAPAAAKADLSLPEVVARSAARIERDLIDSTLARCRGNRASTAQALGINRKTLFRKIRQYELRRWIDPAEADE